MNTIKLIYTFLLISFTIITAQPSVEWTRLYHGPMNGGSIDKMVVDQNNFIYVSGQNVGSANTYDIVTIKYNSEGDSLWVRRYSSGAQSEVFGLAVDDFGNVYITGFTVIAGVPRAITIKYSSLGDVVWQKLYESSSDNRSVGIGIDDSGNVYTAGSSNANGDWGIEIVKYNPSNGDEIWTARYDQTLSSLDIPMAMTVDNAGKVYVAGYSQDSGINKAMLIKYNTDGMFQWANLYNIPNVTGEILGSSVEVDDEGNVYVAGHCYNGQATFVDMLVYKCNSDGNTLWTNEFSNSMATDIANDIAVDNTGNVYVTGKTFVGGGGSNNYDYLTVKFSMDGNVVWHSTYDGPEYQTEDEARALLLDDMGNCYVTGGSSVSSLYYAGDFATVKYDMNGNEIWAIRNLSRDFGGYGIGMDNTGYIYIAGSQMANFCTVKINPGDIVPVDLTSFTAEMKEHDVIICWSTASETNNMGFEIEKRSENDAWKSLGFILGQGTVTEYNNYTFPDINNEDGFYSYRLKQINFDATFEYSHIISVDLKQVKKDFYLYQNYPNPFNPKTIIMYSIPEKGFVSLSIYDLLGREVESLVNEEKDAGTYEINFDGSNLSSGVYIYWLKSGSFTNAKRLILMK